MSRSKLATEKDLRRCSKWAKRQQAAHFKLDQLLSAAIEFRAQVLVPAALDSSH